MNARLMKTSLVIDVVTTITPRTANQMRRMLSIQSGRALFRTVPRALLVCGLLAAYYVAAMWVEPLLPWWIVMLAGLVLLAALAYLGSVWLDRDILRETREDPAESESNRQSAE